MLDRVVPFLEHEAASDDFPGQQTGRFIRWRRLNPFGGQSEVAEPQQLGGLHAPSRGIVSHAQVGLDVLGEQFAQPVRLDGRGERQDGVDLLVPALDFADFGGHKERTVLNHAFAREHTAPPVHEFATERAGVESASDAIREADEDALLQRLVRDFAGLHFETLAFGDAEEMIEQRPDLSCRDGVDAKLAAGIEPEVVFRRVGPGAHENPEVRRSFLAEKVLASRVDVASGIAKQQVATLRKRGDEAGLIDTTVFLRGEQHPRVTRVHRKREHATAGRSD